MLSKEGVLLTGRDILRFIFQTVSKGTQLIMIVLLYDASYKTATALWLDETEPLAERINYCSPVFPTSN